MQLQLAIPDDHSSAPSTEAYLRSQLITYIGNKRSLLDFIGSAVDQVMARDPSRPWRTLDMFAGSGVVSRLLKTRSNFVWANDIERYSSVANTCFLTNPSSFNHEKLSSYFKDIEILARERPTRDGFVRRLYSPEDPARIEPHERVFYTPENAEIIDSCAPAILSLPKPYSTLLMGPFLSACSKHVNTSGVFKGFYKNAEGIGQFGGTMRNALQRILKRIEIEKPVLIEAPCDFITTALPAEKLVDAMDSVDIAYLDPPYNQHPYGSNYFMLNAICQYREPQDISRVSGIPNNWNRSAFNKPKPALAAMAKCIRDVKAKTIVLSYNSEGFLSIEDMQLLMEEFGELKVMSVDYPTFRGCRNLRDRDKSVKEFIFLLDKE